MASCQTSAFSDRFKSKQLSQLYAKYRPSHTQETYEFMINFLRKKLPAPNQLVIDVGCGTGNSTRPLAEYFENVIGCDISETQIGEAQTEARNSHNVHFRVGDFKNLPAEEKSVDLVTVANAVHWFHPVEDFHRDVERVLKPGGCLCIYATVFDHFVHEKADILNKFYTELKNDPRLEPYANDRVTYYREGCPYINPYEDYIKETSMRATLSITLSGFLGRCRSLSWVYPYYRDHPNNTTGPLEDLHEKLKPYYGGGNPDNIEITIRHAIYINIGRKPGK